MRGPDEARAFIESMIEASIDVGDFDTADLHIALLDEADGDTDQEYGEPGEDDARSLEKATEFTPQFVGGDDTD